MAELTLEQSVSEILPTLPPPVRNFFKKGRLDEVVQLIVDRYALHVDHGAILEHHLITVLLGIEGPEEFATELFAQLPISEQTVKDILADLNKEVFVPIREEMRRGATATLAPAKPFVSQPTQRAMPQSHPRPIIQQQQNPAADPEHYFHLRNKIPPSPNPKRLLGNHEEPHIKISADTQGVDKSSFVPPNLPGRIEHPPLPVPPPAPKQIQPVSPPPPAPKPYSSDPYREPIGP